MNLKEALDTLLAGGELTPESREMLARFDPEALREELSTLKSQLEEQENAKLSAEELLRKQLESALSEKETLLKQQQTLERNAMIRQMADRTGCEDPDYLDYLARKEEVDLNDPALRESFLARTMERCPNFFRTSLHPGSGSAGGRDLAQLSPSGERCDRISRILHSLDSAPEIR